MSKKKKSDKSAVFDQKIEAVILAERLATQRHLNACVMLFLNEYPINCWPTMLAEAVANAERQSDGLPVTLSTFYKLSQRVPAQE